MALAVSFVGLSPNDFWDLTPKEFDLILLLNQRKQDNIYKADMERMRIQTLYLVNIHMGKNSIKSVEEFMPFTWDIKQHTSSKATPFTDEEAAYYEAKINKPIIEKHDDIIDMINHK